MAEPLDGKSTEYKIEDTILAIVRLSKEYNAEEDGRRRAPITVRLHDKIGLLHKLRKEQTLFAGYGGKTNLQCAAESMLTEARRQRDKGGCSNCDPGNEGAEVWAELVDGMEKALKAEQAERR